MKKIIIKLIIPSLLFLMALTFSINNSKAFAQSSGGTMCLNGFSSMCVWYNEDGSVDYMCWGMLWMPEQE